MTTLIFLVFMSLDPSATWREANQLYQEGVFEQALAKYEALYQSGVDNGPLHFNLGNSYLKNERLGKAILHYYKARNFLPGDEDVRNNLEIANQMRVDPIIDGENEGSTPAFLSAIFRRLPYQVVFIIAFSALCLGGLASLAMIARPQAGKWVGYVLVLGGVIGLLAAGLAFAQYQTLSRTDFAVIVETKVDVLAGPTTRESVNFTIHEGIRCQVLEASPGWYRIRLANGYNGWVPRTALERI